MGAQILKEAVAIIQDAASRIDTSKEDINSALLEGIDKFSSNVSWGSIWLGAREMELEKEMKQHALTAVVNAVRNINLLQSLIDPFLALFRQGE